MKNLVLHSFGDSFTYGDGIFPSPIGASDATVALFDKKRAAKTYTGLLGQHFKETINYGLPASNNEYTLMRMMTVVNDPDFDPTTSFFLINLTDPARMGFSITNNNVDEYSLLNVHSLNRLTDNDIPIKSIPGVALSLFDDMANIYRYYTTLASIQHLLENIGVRYYMFNGINGIDQNMTDSCRFNKLEERFKGKKFYAPDRILNKQSRMNTTIIDHYKALLGKFKHFDLYRDTLVSHEKLGFDETITLYRSDIISCYNMVKLMDIYATKKYNNEHYYKSKLIFDDGHWNEVGHKLVSRILLDRIQVQNYDYLDGGTNE